MRKKVASKIIADGEATGHHHKVVGVAEVFAEEGSTARIVEASENCKVTHQEHKEIDLPAGIYRSDKVVEYDAFADEARQVRD